MSTQVNLGASYLVHDGWARFIRPDADEAAKVRAGRWASLLSLLAGALLSLTLTSAGQAFNLLLLLGAGTGGSSSCAGFGGAFPPAPKSWPWPYHWWLLRISHGSTTVWVGGPWQTGPSLWLEAS